MRPIQVFDARDLPEGWMNLLREIMFNGRVYEVIEGSRAGESRRSIDGIGYILHPEHRPLAPMPRTGLPSPTSVSGIQEYFEDYLIREDGPPGSKAHYVYGKWLAPMVEWAAEYLAKWGPGQAHCCLRVGDPYDAKQYDVNYLMPCPCIEMFGKASKSCVLCKGTGQMKDETKRITTPCLVNFSLQVVPRGIDFYLVHHITYRSWDAFSGWPENMGGFQLFKETIFELMQAYQPFAWLEPGSKFLLGPCTWRSWDIHVYSGDWDAANAWIGL